MRLGVFDCEPEDISRRRCLANSTKLIVHFEIVVFVYTCRASKTESADLPRRLALPRGSRNGQSRVQVQPITTRLNLLTLRVPYIATQVIPASLVRFLLTSERLQDSQKPPKSFCNNRFPSVSSTTQPWRPKQLHSSSKRSAPTPQAPKPPTTTVWALRRQSDTGVRLSVHRLLARLQSRRLQPRTRGLPTCKFCPAWR